MAHDGKTETYTRTVSVTGLPYHAAPPTNSGDHPWTKVAGRTINWETGYVHMEGGAVNVSSSWVPKYEYPEPSIQSPDFHIPGSINIHVKSNYTRNNDGRADDKHYKYSITLAGSGALVCEDAQGEGTHTPEGNSTFDSSSKGVLCTYKYGHSSIYASVNTVDITYR